MKKICLIILAILIIILLNKKVEDYVIVPNDSIRFRIIPNSNSVQDLYMKEQVKKNIYSYIEEIEKATNIEDSRNKITSNLSKIEENISNLFAEKNYNQQFKINYGVNHFPEKIYKGVKYEEGDYESMVIEIGSSSGDNYWCVLFPPLCMIEEDETEEIEYKFFISEIINKFIKKN